MRPEALLSWHPWAIRGLWECLCCLASKTLISESDVFSIKIIICWPCITTAKFKWGDLICRERNTHQLNTSAMFYRYRSEEHTFCIYLMKEMLCHGNRLNLLFQRKKHVPDVKLYARYQHKIRPDQGWMTQFCALRNENTLPRIYNWEKFVLRWNVGLSR